MTDRTFQDYSAIINVKDSGAIGDGSTDDSVAIQAAFDAAFGTAASPHGNGGGPINKAVYFPPGRYRTTTPVKVTNVWGGRIFGDGNLCSILDYQGALTPVNADNIVPTLWLNGCGYCTISDLSFWGQSDPTNHYTAGLWFGPDGLQGGTSSHANTIINCSTQTTSVGFRHGSAASSANSENTYVGCSSTGHELAGYYLSGANTLNIRLTGCGIDHCGTGLRSNNNAGALLILNPSLAVNNVDFDLSGGAQATIIGARTESAAFVKTAGHVQVINSLASVAFDTVTGSTSGTTLTVSAVGTQGNIIKVGHIVTAANGGNSLPSAYPNTTRILAQLTGTPNGAGTYTLSHAATPGNLAAGTTFSLTPCYLEATGGNIIIDSGGSITQVAIIGDNNSSLRLRANNFYDAFFAANIPPNLLTWFTGYILEYDMSTRTTVAALPTAATGLRGLRLFVTDSNVAVTDETRFGDVVAGSGANTVPVWCDGTNWRIG